jgi:hypothetical protein
MALLIYQGKNISSVPAFIHTPLHQCCTPCKSTAESRQQKVVALYQFVSRRKGQIWGIEQPGRQMKLSSQEQHMVYTKIK